MEDQGKRLLLAVALAFVIMLVWQSLFSPDKTEKAPEQTDSTSEQSTDGQKKADDTDLATPDKPRTVELAEPDGATPTEAAAPVEEPNRCVEEDQADPLVFDMHTFRAEFSRCGGTLKSWQLAGEKYELSDGGQMDLLPTGENPEQRSFAVRFEDVDWDPFAYWKAERKSGTEIQFKWDYEVEGADGKRRTAFELTKIYRLYPDDFLVELSVQIANKAAKDERQSLVVSLFGYQDPSADTEGGWTSVDTAWRSSCYISDEESRSSVGSLQDGPRIREARNLKWGGFAHSYFLVALSPRNETGALYDCNSHGIPTDGRPGVMRTDIGFPATPIQLGSWTETRMVAYLGPKYLDKLESISEIVGYNTGFGEAIDLGWFSFLARPMLWLLQWFYSFLGNWGLAIICLTFLVKLLTLYWTTKSMRSMKKMAKLTPKVKELQEKYKDDKPRLQQETMNLYRSHNVNPVAGCLPILLQMPIWIALYRMLMYAAELYHAPLIEGWIDDLTATDPYYILPVALLIVMFVQAKLTPAASDSMQQKMMQYGMPIMFGVFSFFFPAGLTLYIFTNTCLTALHHLWMRHTDDANAAQEQKDSQAKDAGKGGSARPAPGARSGSLSGRKGKSKGGARASDKSSGRTPSTKTTARASAETREDGDEGAEREDLDREHLDRDATDDDSSETGEMGGSSDDGAPTATNKSGASSKSRSKRRGGKRRRKS